ncbi:hypothetical protein TWF173_004989 [Orbilia oligospora]|nr:hypothetical protein TWF173_004989 [Orbilia oligospora]
MGQGSRGEVPRETETRTIRVREAEIFYQILTKDEKSQRLSQWVYDKIWEQEDLEWKFTNHLQLLMGLNADEPEIIPGQQQQGGQVNIAQPQAAAPNLSTDGIQTASSQSYS